MGPDQWHASRSIGRWRDATSGGISPEGLSRVNPNRALSDALWVCDTTDRPNLLMKPAACFRPLLGWLSTFVPRFLGAFCVLLGRGRAVGSRRSKSALGVKGSRLVQESCPCTGRLGDGRPRGGPSPRDGGSRRCRGRAVRGTGVHAHASCMAARVGSPTAGNHGVKAPPVHSSSTGGPRARPASGVSHPSPQADHLRRGRGVVNARAGLLLRSPKTSPHYGLRGYLSSEVFSQSILEEAAAALSLSRYMSVYNLTCQPASCAVYKYIYIFL